MCLNVDFSTGSSDTVRIIVRGPLTRSTKISTSCSGRLSPPSRVVHSPTLQLEVGCEHLSRG